MILVMKMPMVEHMQRGDLKEARLKPRATVTAHFHLLKIQVTHTQMAEPEGISCPQRLYLRILVGFILHNKHR